jgi:hypothetical protein
MKPLCAYAEALAQALGVKYFIKKDISSLRDSISFLFVFL